MYNRHPVKRYQITRSTTTPFKTGFICSNNTKYVSVLRCKVLEITESLIGDAIYSGKVGFSAQKDPPKTINPLTEDEAVQWHTLTGEIIKAWEEETNEKRIEEQDLTDKLSTITQEKDYLINEFNKNHDKLLINKIFEKSKEEIENLLRLTVIQNRCRMNVRSILQEFISNFTPLVVTGSPNVIAQQFCELIDLFKITVHEYCKSYAMHEIQSPILRIIYTVIRMIVQCETCTANQVLNEVRDFI